MARNEFSFQTPEQRAENGRKGGIASGIAKAKKREARAVIEAFLSMPLKRGKIADIEEIQSFMDLKGKNITVNEAIQLQLVQKALKGDLTAMNMVLALNGEKPADKVDVNANVTQNPMQDLTSEELRKLIQQHDNNK